MVVGFVRFGHQLAVAGSAAVIEPNQKSILNTGPALKLLLARLTCADCRSENVSVEPIVIPELKLRDVQRQDRPQAPIDELDGEAKELFSPKSRTKTISRAIEEYKQARSEVRRLAISAGMVKQRQTELDAAREALEKLKTESQSLHQELVRLRRVGALPRRTAAIGRFLRRFG